MSGRFDVEWVSVAVAVLLALAAIGGIYAEMNSQILVAEQKLVSHKEDKHHLEGAIKSEEDSIKALSNRVIVAEDSIQSLKENTEQLRHSVDKLKEEVVEVKVKVSIIADRFERRDSE